MKEWLDYVKSTGEEIKNLNDEIKKLNGDNKKLIIRIQELERELTDKRQQVKNISDLANRWYDEYTDLIQENRHLRCKYDVVSIGLATIAPKFKKDIEDDLDEGLMSELLHELRDLNRKGW